MADMIKFYKGLEASLPATGANGALYITTDEGAIYLGTGTGMKRLGDFIQVANVEALPEKAHESCLYYCVAENILAKWNGTEWKQINKQPTAEELKILLGLGTLAYKSEVAEDDLNDALKEKVNAAAEGNHSHSNKGVLDGITAEKVTAWDNAEKNAKDHADGLNTAMNTRVEALEAIDHDHANKAELDLIATGDKAKWDAAAEKAHTHANADELAKIADGDKAKWDAVAADHLTSADKTTLENSIKEAKKAGTDANTALETYKVANDARVLAVEEDIAEINDADNGILAQAKAYADGKDGAIAEAKAAGTTAQSNLEAYQTSNNEALAGVKATAEAAATKAYTDEELAKKVDKVEGKSLIDDTEITRLKDVDNYDDTAIKADIAKKADAEEVGVELGKKVDKVDGYSLVSDTEIARLAEVDNYDDTALAGRVTTAEGKITALEGASATHATKDELNAVDAKFADYNTTAAQKEIDDAQDAAIKAIADDYVKAADIANFETKENVKKVADDLAAYVESNDEALAGVKTTADAAAVKTEVEAALALKADKTALKETNDTLAEVKTTVDNFFAEDAAINDTIDTLKEIANYIATDKEGAADITARVGALEGKVDVEKVTTAIADAVKEETDRATGAENVLSGRIDTLEAIDHDAYKTADTTLKSELQAEIDADVKALEDGAVATNATNIAANTAAIATKANTADVYAKTEVYTKTEVDALFTWGEF